jgi:hypothetical protein
MVFHIFGTAGAALLSRLGYSGVTAIGTPASFSGREFISSFYRQPLIQGGQFGVGYTAGAYGGYGATNTWDPFGLHKPKYKHYQQKLRLPYGYYGRRTGRFRRYRGFRRRSYRSYNPYRRYRRSYY